MQDHQRFLELFLLVEETIVNSLITGAKHPRPFSEIALAIRAASTEGRQNAMVKSHEVSLMNEIFSAHEFCLLPICSDVRLLLK